MSLFELFVDEIRILRFDRNLRLHRASSRGLRLDCSNFDCLDSAILDNDGSNLRDCVRRFESFCFVVCRGDNAKLIWTNVRLHHKKVNQLVPAETQAQEEELTLPTFLPVKILDRSS